MDLHSSQSRHVDLLPTDWFALGEDICNPPLVKSPELLAFVEEARVPQTYNATRERWECTCKTVTGGESDEVILVECDACADFRSLEATEPDAVESAYSDLFPLRIAR